MTPCITYKRLREVYSNTASPNHYIARTGPYYLHNSAINSTRVVLSCQAIMYNVGISCRGSILVNQTFNSGWCLSIGDYYTRFALRLSGNRYELLTKFFRYYLSYYKRRSYYSVYIWCDDNSRMVSAVMRVIQQVCCAFVNWYVRPG